MLFPARILICSWCFPNLEKATLDTALDIAWEIGFEAGVVLSVVPATKGEIARLAASPFYQAVQRDGVTA